MAHDPKLEFCQSSLPHLTTYADAFLLVSIIAAVGLLLISTVQALLALAPHQRVMMKSFTFSDPDKVLDAMTNLVKALTAAPTWLAIFLAGGALQLLAYYESTGGCAPPPPPPAAATQPLHTSGTR